MPKKREPSIELCKKRNNRVLRLNHVHLQDGDEEWLAGVERLTCWNVKMPLGLLGKLPKLWWLDVRGGSGVNLSNVLGTTGLRYLAVNQVLGMTDLSAILELASLQYLDLYGLPRVTNLPSMRFLANLARVNLGPMKGLRSIGGVLDAPNLRQLELRKQIHVSPEDLRRINQNPILKAFTWFAEDVPVRQWEPVVSQIRLAPVPIQFPEEWFELPDFVNPHLTRPT